MTQEEFNAWLAKSWSIEAAHRTKKLVQGQWKHVWVLVFLNRESTSFSLIA